ncbi:phosphotransferase enzyme family protein [Actinopolymorpha singaporensis]|uniref:Homoserine kinase type II n=1 Tax=Actinopolymorpha singaporensis TaxID=117157 RepID=A0A1H1M4L2_9ACTN|nr:phosphotransferase [Actinopolymorpha singaporensis]SDR81666.1 homoserine kinase type II [Actinopolymorpha singaporensis]
MDGAAEVERGERATTTGELLRAVRTTFELDDEPPLGTSSGTPGDLGIRDLGGSSNLNLLAKRAGRPVVVRVYLPWVDSTRLADLQRIRDLLRDAGVPTPRTLPTADGRPWASFDGRLVEMEEYVEHDADMDTWNRLDAGTPALGRIHSVLDGVDAAPGTRRPAFANAVDAADAQAMTARGVARIRSWGEISTDVASMCDEAEEIAEIVASAEAAVPPTHPQLVHGDFWDNNVLFRSGLVAGVIDLDFLGRRPRVDDLALTLFFADQTLLPAMDDRIRLLRRLVDRYESGLDQPLTSDERVAVPAALARQQLWAFGHVANLDEKSARSLVSVMVGEVRRTLPIARDLPGWRTAFARAGS